MFLVRRSHVHDLASDWEGTSETPRAGKRLKKQPFSPRWRKSPLHSWVDRSIQATHECRADGRDQTSCRRGGQSAEKRHPPDCGKVPPLFDMNCTNTGGEIRDEFKEMRALLRLSFS
jgi:hypothetical protein